MPDFILYNHGSIMSGGRFIFTSHWLQDGSGKAVYRVVDDKGETLTEYILKPEYIEALIKRGGLTRIGIAGALELYRNARSA